MGLRLDTSLPQQPILVSREKLKENWFTYKRDIVVFAHGSILALVMGTVTISLDKPISNVMIEAILFAQRRRLAGHRREYKPEKLGGLCGWWGGELRDAACASEVGGNSG